MTSSTLRCRGVSPLSSGGPSGISVTVVPDSRLLTPPPRVSIAPVPGSPVRGHASGRIEKDGSDSAPRIQTHVRKTVDFVGWLGYNFVRVFDRKHVRVDDRGCRLWPARLSTSRRSL